MKELLTTPAVGRTYGKLRRRWKKTGDGKQVPLKMSITFGQLNDRNIRKKARTKSDDDRRQEQSDRLQVQVDIEAFLLGKVLYRHLLKLPGIIRYRAAELHAQKKHQKNQELLVPEPEHIQGPTIGRANVAVHFATMVRDRQKINTPTMSVTQRDGHLGLTRTTTFLLAGVPLLYAFN